jgi:GGDEF domain-containing protein
MPRLQPFAGWLIIPLMDTIEISIWAAMTGALVLLLAAALADVATGKRLAAWRGLFFLLLTGASAVLMTGFPEYLLGMEQSTTLLPAKAALGPLSGALALGYLGMWLGIVLEDKLIRHTVAGGSMFLVLAGAALAVWAYVDTDRESFDFLAVSAVVNFCSVIFAAVVAVRGAILGDPLARAMAAACVCLAGMVGGLYAKGLQVAGFGNGIWLLTALCTVGYFLIVIVLTIVRNREQRRLQRLARGVHSADVVTGLPTGIELMTQVDDAMWRSERVKREAVVIAVWVANLYELSSVAGQQVDQEIRSSLTARLRRAVGFRNVVGLYHPRCFIVVVSAVQDARVVRKVAERLRRYLLEPMLVGVLTHDDHTYRPEMGIGIVRVEGTHAQPSVAMDDAEQLAQAARGVEGGIAIRCLGDRHVTALARYQFDVHDIAAPSSRVPQSTSHG